MLVGIDPGHGGKDPGAVNERLGIREKELTLSIGRKLEQRLKDNNIDTITTRGEDVYVSLPNRNALLNKAGVDYVVSIHINSSHSAEANYLSSHIIARGGEAEQLAEQLEQQLVEQTGWPDGGVRVSNFYMLRETKAPAVLVELGFISHPETARLLGTDQIQSKLAAALAGGVMNYLGAGGQIILPGLPDDVYGHWAEHAILWAVENGLLHGVSEHQFAPDEPVTRAQLAIVLKRFHDKFVQP